MAAHDRAFFGANASEIQDVALAVRVLLAFYSMRVCGSLQQFGSQKFCVRLSNVESRGEHSRLVASPRVLRVQDVVPQLSNIYDGMLAVWQTHYMRLPENSPISLHLPG